MTRIDFYTLGAGYRGDRFLFACRLVEKIRAQELRVLIHCPDAGQARALDRLMWSFRDESFIPHGLIGQVDPDLTPVLISPDGQPENERQVLINLALEAPAFFTRFERVCELIDQTPEVLAAGRRRWSWYKANNHLVTHHQIAA